MTKYMSDRDFSKEFEFSATRSSGPGGQNVNKVNTRVELRFNVNTSTLLSDHEKAIIKEKLKSQLTSEGFLILTSQTERSQLKNKEKVIQRFYTIITKALTPRKRRIPTKPTFSSTLKKLEKKRKHSDKKALRKRNF
jgi:ribosome-associated protein